MTKKPPANKIILTAAGVLATIGISLLLLGKSDAVVFWEWYIYLIAITLMSIPLSRILFKNCESLMPFGKTLGFALPGFVVWVLGVVAGISFNQVTCLAVTLIYLIFNIVIAKQQKMTAEDIKSAISLKYELIFFAVFLFWTYLIGFNSSAYGTEKFMDYAFLQKMLVSSKLPPDDVWFAGKSINYYYGGQYYAAFIAKTLLGGDAKKAEYAYNMMRAVIPALMFSGVFGISEQMIKDRTEKLKLKKSRLKVNGFASLSAFVAVFAGNAHYIVYRIIKPLFNISGENSYWFPDATRYIGYNPVVENDQTIHEFPCYSFVLGDLHAHMINIMFVILVIALLYSFLKMRQSRGITLKKVLAFPQLYITGIIWGLFNWTNYWDFIIYIVVIALTVIGANLISEDKIKNALGFSIIQIIVTAIIGIIAVMPFTMNFESVFKGVGIAKHHSAFYQLLILWGIPIFMVIVFVCLFIANIVKNMKSGSFRSARKEILPPDIFTFILGCSAIGLVLIPELVYVIDIYEATHARANTMFKLTYQSFIMFSICTGYILYILTENKKRVMRVIAWILVSLEILMLGYFFNAANSWFGFWTTPSLRKGTDALVYLDEADFSAEKNALLWMKNLSESQEIDGAVAEAPGDSYTACERVSVISGISAPAGWKVHEWLWRDSLDGITSRADDMDFIYNNASAKVKAKEIIDKYNIKYIFFGTRETERYGESAKEDVKALGKVVYEDDGAFIVEVE